MPWTRARPRATRTAATSAAEVDDIRTEWEDRYGPLPPRAQALIEIARLRVEALRVGLTEVVRLRHEVKLAPVGLSASQEVRLQRLAPERSPATALAGFIRTMWPSDTQE